MTPAEVAALFGVSSGQVGRWARERKIPSFRTPGGHLRFRWSAVEPMLRQTGTTVPAEPEAVGA